MMITLAYNLRLVTAFIAVLVALSLFPMNGQAALEQPVDATVTTLAKDQLSSSSSSSAATQPASQNDQTKKTFYSEQSVKLVICLMVLLGLLFWFLLKWSHQLDQASYLGDVYRESVEDFEYKRLFNTPTEKLLKKEYHHEIVRDSKWLETNEKPLMPADCFWQDPWDCSAGRSSGSSGLLLGGAPRSASGNNITPEAQATEKTALNALESWWQKVENEANSRYNKELSENRTLAKKRAKLATNVDFSALRGRGGEFVLEFTTVVVIIFSTMILGVLGILDPQQIGTLLAAIAGYVLGRSATRASVGAKEKPAETKPVTDIDKSK